MSDNARLLQKELIDQAQLHKFKDGDKNKKIESKFREFIELAKDAESIQKLRKKVTHDIEHQINDCITLREQIAKMAGVTVEKIRIPELRPNEPTALKSGNILYSQPKANILYS